MKNFLRPIFLLALFTIALFLMFIYSTKVSFVYAQQSSEELPAIDDYQKKPGGYTPEGYQSLAVGGLNNPYPVADAMVRADYPYYNYGGWRMMTTGYFQDPASYAVISNAQSYIKFDLAPISSLSMVDSAYLEVWQYVRSVGGYGNYTIEAQKVTSNWSEGEITWSNKPGVASPVSSTIASGDCCYLEYRKFTFNVTSLVESWKNGSTNYGLRLESPSGTRGGALCTKNSDSVCPSQYMPKLIVNFSQNHPPNTPNPLSPANGYETSNSTVNLKVSNVGDTDGNIDGTWFYYRKGSGSWANSSKIGGSGSLVYTRNYSDGNWYWRVRSKDKLGLWGNYSVEKKFIVDTTPPSQPQLEKEPEFSPGTTNKLVSTIAYDAGVGEVKYLFQMSKDNFSTIERETNWGLSNEHTFITLENDQKYYYRVMAKDMLHNKTSWSSIESSIQDSVFPVIINIELVNQRFSPNQDGNFDDTELSFQIIEKNIAQWLVEIYSVDNEHITTYEGSDLNPSVIWDGRNKDGEIAEDGAYILKIIVKDKAGNITNGSEEVIVDNTSPILNISDPKDESWFNTDVIRISGITEDGAILKINELEVEVEEGTGIFEQELMLSNEGNNTFEIVAIDSVGNNTYAELIVNKDIHAPNIEIVSPSDITNNSKFQIVAEFHDNTEQSGIKINSVYLEISGLVLVVHGENLHPEFGHIEHSNLNDGIYEWKYIFTEEVGVDRDFNLKIRVSDRAGNISESTKTFELDTHTHLIINKPLSEKLFNYSKIDIEGSAELGGELVVKNGLQTFTLNIDPDDHNVTNCREIDLDDPEFASWKAGKKICDFVVNDFKLISDTENDIWLDNIIDLEVRDEVGNSEAESVNLQVNLYAVELSIESSLDYFSPNQDGVQDFVDFDLFSDGMIDSWGVEIKSGDGQIVMSLDGKNDLPPNVIWNGKDENGNLVVDGEYFYNLWIQTIDGIEFKTEPKTIYAKSSVEGEVVITYPKNNYVTTRGVVLTQGLAPLGSVVTVFYKPIGVAGDDESYMQGIAEPDENGNFSFITAIYQSQGNIYVKATDKYGNDTPKSNEVFVKLDFADPLVGIGAYPELAGVNQLINLESIVTQNTELVQIDFAEHTNLNELSDWDSLNWNEIGESGYNCQNPECIWNLEWMTPKVKGGVYEIKFIGKKSEKVQEMSLGVRIDGTIPSSPHITKVFRQSDGSILNRFNNDYYINEQEVIVHGVAEPLVKVKVFDSENNLFGETYTNSLGLWKVNGTLGVEEGKYTYFAQSFDQVNDGEVSDLLYINLDKTAPKFIKYEISPDYLQSGVKTTFEIISDEETVSSNVVFPDGAEYDLFQVNYLKYISELTMPSVWEEGEKEIKAYLTDLAGNISKSYQKVIVDYTPPEKTNINTGDWNKGRLVPGFVTKEKTVTLKGKAEKGAKVKIYINSYNIDRVNVSDKNCIGKSLSYQGVTTTLCDWSYTYKFPQYGSGKSIERGYIFQTKVEDRARNVSSLSNEVLLYTDETPPDIVKEYEWQPKTIEKEFFTNKRDITLKGYAERLSDLKIYINSKLVHSFRNSAKGNWSKNISFNVEGKNVVKIQSSDAAGNSSKFLTFTIIRDTIPPDRPLLVAEGFQNERRIQLEIWGEKYSEAMVRVYSGSRNFGNFVFILGDDGYFNFNNAIINWDWGATYSFEVKIKDRAGNIGNANVVLYEVGGTGGPDVLGESTEVDHYYAKSVEKVKAVARVYPDDNGYRVELEFDLPTPLLTDTETFSSGEVKVWGVIPNLGEIDIEFYKYKSSSPVDTISKCWWKTVITPWGMYCVYDDQSKKGYDLDYNIENQKFDPQNIIISVWREKDGQVTEVLNSISIRNAGTSRSLSGGKWYYTFSGEKLKPNDKIFAKIRVYGFYNYGGVGFHYDKWSRESNRLTVQNRDVFDPISPVINCPGNAIITQGFHSAHPAIDVYVSQECWISSVDDGILFDAGDTEVSKGILFNGCGVGTHVSHPDNYKSLYCHGYKDIYGNSSLKVSVSSNVSKNNLSKGQEMFQMGESGVANGKHLHMSFSQNNIPIDPLTLMNI